MSTRPGEGIFQPPTKDVPPSRTIAYIFCFGISVLGVPILLLGLLLDLISGDPGPLYLAGMFIIVFPWALWALIRVIKIIWKQARR
ncbi:MAG: hypothetical protein ACE5OZ_25280 [Candidatus Heimdallarchaeota archaeon]